MKLFIPFFLTLIILSSCFSSWESLQGESVWLVPVEQEGFSMSLPINWQEVSEFELVTPSQWELVLAYRASEERNGYFNNIVVLKNQNRLRETSTSLMQNNINALKLSMQNFQVIAEDTLSFPGNTQWEVIVFEGQYGPQTPMLHYIQTARSCDEDSYFLTISVGSELWDYTRYYPLLESFRCN